MNRSPLKLVEPLPKTAADLAREAQAVAQRHAAEAIAAALEACESAKVQLDGLSDLPIREGVKQAAHTLGRAIDMNVKLITSLLERG